MAVRNVLIKQWNSSVWDDIYPRTTIDQVINLSTVLSDLNNAIGGKANLVGANFTGNISAPWFGSGSRRIGQYTTSHPGNDFGPGRTFVRLWETSEGAGFISGKISISGIWSYSAIMGILEIETGVYVAQGATSISYGSSRLISATSTAIDNLRIGNIEVVGGYVGFYVYSQNSNNINISYDLNVSTPGGTLLWTNTSWESIALPTQRTIEFQTDVKIHGQSVVINNDARLTDSRPASDVQTWAKAANKPSYHLGEIAETVTYKRVTELEKNAWSGKQDALGYTPENASNKRISIRTSGADNTNYVSELGVKTYVDDVAATKEPAITKGFVSQYFRGDMSLATFPTIPTLPTAMSVSEGEVGTAVTLRSMRADYLKQIIEHYTGVDRAIDTKTSNYTLVIGDNGKTIVFNSTTSYTLTIPANASVAFPIGAEINIIRQGTGEVTIAITTDTLLSEGSKKRINERYQAVTLKKIASTTWIIIGALKT